MVMLTKKAPRAHGRVEPKDIGLSRHGGEWYYRISNLNKNKLEDRRAYRVYVNNTRTAATRCTCDDYQHYRSTLDPLLYPEAESRMCKHMIAINARLAPTGTAEHYEAELAYYREEIARLRTLIEQEQKIYDNYS